MPDQSGRQPRYPVHADGNGVPPCGRPAAICVEVAVCPDTVHVRDSKDIAGPQLVFAPSAWAAFVANYGRG
ncbi:DUF397 domain-containing protein [Streptomyces humicola]|uniref:DUF397 domain-containing protein n=1 Tax=Streptomyces humicola TaxID=2953240 RepID=UPI0035567CFE